MAKTIRSAKTRDSATSLTQSNTCPECGAPSTPELNCQSAFDNCLVMEFTNADFGAVHHLTVATYMLQHSSKLSLEGWLSMRGLLREFLVENKSPLEVRRTNRSLVDSGKRTWKFSSPDGLPKIGQVRWTMTILDVRMEPAELYCADINKWAAAVLADAMLVDTD